MLVAMSCELLPALLSNMSVLPPSVTALVTVRVPAVDGPPGAIVEFAILLTLPLTTPLPVSFCPLDRVNWPDGLRETSKVEFTLMLVLLAIEPLLVNASVPALIVVPPV